MQIKLNAIETETLLDVELVLSEFVEQLEAIGNREQSEVVLRVVDNFLKFRSKLLLDEEIVNN